ncbi:hypothetical protein VYU27_005873 [Nannochloropsis oceanica]
MSRPPPQPSPSPPDQAPPRSASEPSSVAASLLEAILALNQLDDAMLVYDDKKTTPLVTSSINTFVQALKKAQDGRHALGEEEIPVQLLERMEREGLNPAVYTMESLEKGVDEVEAVAVRDEMLEEIKRGIEEGMKRKEGGKKGGEEEAVAAMDVEDP